MQSLYYDTKDWNQDQSKNTRLLLSSKQHQQRSMAQNDVYAQATSVRAAQQPLSPPPFCKSMFPARHRISRISYA